MFDLSDTHMHTCFSGDSDTPIREMIETSIEKGLSVICITDHHDPDFPDGDTRFLLDTERYYKTLSAYRDEYHKQIDLRIGVEIGLQPHLAPYFHEFVHEYPFDFVIGSTHLVGGQDPYYPAFFQGRMEADAYRQYFDEVYDNLCAFSDFDVCGHLDYVVRYGPNKNRFYSYENYQPQLEKILRLMVEKNIGLEVNTGGYKSGLGTTNPMPEIIRRYLALGGNIITLGADAHVPDYIAYEFQTALELLKSCGVKEMCTFKDRKPVYQKLPV